MTQRRTGRLIGLRRFLDVCPQRLRKTTQSVSQDIHFPDRESNQPHTALQPLYRDVTAVWTATNTRTLAFEILLKVESTTWRRAKCRPAMQLGCNSSCPPHV